MKKYDIVYADPPWKYADKSLSHGGGAESHYPTMGIEEICKLGVGELAKDNSILFLWVTLPMLREGMKVMNAWKFAFKTVAFVWIKANRRKKENQISFLDTGIDDFMGMGRWTEVERGNMFPRNARKHFEEIAERQANNICSD